MKLFLLLALTTLVAKPAIAEGTRQLGSHEHGVGQLNIAFEGSQIAIALRAPGADIVGFEYVAKNEEDQAKVEAALLALTQPLDLFVVPSAARCSVVQAEAELESEADHDDHADNDSEGHDDHNHDDHVGGEHDDHENEVIHTEFHAEYLLTCENIPTLNEISFAYFTAFPNALEVEVKVITDTGAAAFEVERDAPVLDLGDIK